MARKVFISFLGTSNYIECKYRNGETVSKPVRFVQEALITDICKDWSDNDQIYIFCTSKDKTGEKGAKEFNWLNNGQDKATTEVERIGLEQRLKDLRGKMNLKPEVEEVDIVAGFSEKETWDIFNTIYSKLKEGDEIYLDVTHAFRSIPLFSIVLFNYSKFMIDTQLISVMYGAFEKLGPQYKAKLIPIEERIVPLMDMTNIVRLQEYNQLASSLKEFGKVGGMKDIISQEGETQQFYTFGKAFSDLDEFIATIDFKNLKKGKYIIDFRNLYKKLERSNQFVPPILNLLNGIEKETEEFRSENSYVNIEAAINWTIKHNWLMQSFPLAEEYIIYRLADKLKDLKPDGMKEKDYRSIISAILGMKEKDFKVNNWKGNLLTYAPITNAIARMDFIKELREPYFYLTSARNSLAHANGCFTYSSLKNKYTPYINKCISYLNEHIDDIIIPKIDKSIKKIFINLSNHPSSQWEEKQINAALQFGEIIDLQFPQVEPNDNNQQIDLLADEYVLKIENMAKGAFVTVHIMGELTFVYAIVSKLKQSGIECYASTSERNVVENNNGLKTSIFKFVNFRRY